MEHCALVIRVGQQGSSAALDRGLLRFYILADRFGMSAEVLAESKIRSPDRATVLDQCDIESRFLPPAKVESSWYACLSQILVTKCDQRCSAAVLIMMRFEAEHDIDDRFGQEA